MGESAPLVESQRRGGENGESEGLALAAPSVERSRRGRERGKGQDGMGESAPAVEGERRNIKKGRRGESKGDGKKTLMHSGKDEGNAARKRMGGEEERSGSAVEVEGEFKDDMRFHSNGRDGTSSFSSSSYARSTNGRGGMGSHSNGRDGISSSTSSYAHTYLNSHPQPRSSHSNNSKGETGVLTYTPRTRSTLRQLVRSLRREERKCASPSFTTCSPRAAEEREDLHGYSRQRRSLFGPAQFGPGFHEDLDGGPKYFGVEPAGVCVCTSVSSLFLCVCVFVIKATLWDTRPPTH